MQNPTFFKMMVKVFLLKLIYIMYLIFLFLKNYFDVSNLNILLDY